MMKYLKLYENFNEFYEEITRNEYFMTSTSVPGPGSGQGALEEFNDYEKKELSKLLPGNRIRINDTLDKFHYGDRVVFTRSTRMIDDYPKNSLIIYDYVEKDKKIRNTRKLYWKMPSIVKDTFGPDSKLFSTEGVDKVAYRLDVMVILKSPDEYYYVNTVASPENVIRDKSRKIFRSTFYDSGPKAGQFEFSKFYKCDQIDGVCELIKDLYYK